MAALAAVLAGCDGVSGTLTYFDDRVDYTSGGVTGSLLTLSRQYTNQPIRWAPVGLFRQVGGSKDFGMGGGDDDQVSFGFANDEGKYFIPAATSGLSNLYIGYCYQLSAPDGSTTASAIVVNSSGGIQCVATPNFSGGSGTVTQNMSASCPNESDGECTEGVSYYTGHEATAAPALVVSTASDVQARFGSLFYDDTLYPNPVRYYWPDAMGDVGGSGGCTGVGGDPLGYFYDAEHICLGAATSRYTREIAHETGHMIQHKELHLTGGATGGCDWDLDTPTDVSGSGGNKCATGEGFASFVAGATYWTDAATDPYWSVLHGGLANGDSKLDANTTAGNGANSRACAGTDVWSSPVDHRGNMAENVARFFWDLYDADNADESVGQQRTLRQVSDSWALFASGTSNHQNNESGSDGRNVKDYDFNDSANLSGTITSNCLGTQS